MINFRGLGNEKGGSSKLSVRHCPVIISKLDFLLINVVVKKAKQLGIEQIFWYGTAHAGNPQNAADDFSLLNEDCSPRPMFNYIKDTCSAW